jgi:hypothetical protein
VFLQNQEKMIATKNIGKISLHLASRLIFRLEKAGLTVRLAKEISASPGNALAEKMMAPVMDNITNFASRQNLLEIKKIKADRRFQKIAEFKIVVSAVPSIDNFRDKHEKEFARFDPKLKDANFCPSEPLEIGQEKTAFIYRILRSPANKDCLRFIRAHGGSLPNAQGLAEAYEQGSQYFSKNLFIIGFDEKENLWCDKFTQPLLPLLGHYASGKPHFCLTSFLGKPGDQDGLLFFK